MDQFNFLLLLSFKFDIMNLIDATWKYKKHYIACYFYELI